MSENKKLVVKVMGESVMTAPLDFERNQSADFAYINKRTLSMLEIPSNFTDSWLGFGLEGFPVERLDEITGDIHDMVMVIRSVFTMGADEEQKTIPFQLVPNKANPDQEDIVLSLLSKYEWRKTDDFYDLFIVTFDEGSVATTVYDKEGYVIKEEVASEAGDSWKTVKYSDDRLTITESYSTEESLVAVKDEFGGLLSVNRSDDTWETYERDDEGKLIKLTTSDGFESFYSVDDDGLITSSSNDDTPDMVSDDKMVLHSIEGILTRTDLNNVVEYNYSAVV